MKSYNASLKPLHANRKRYRPPSSKPARLPKSPALLPKAPSGQAAIRRGLNRSS